jgi:ABC transport system ATP-binding/permease protein
MTKPVLYIKDAFIAFGSKTILDEVELCVYKHDKIALIGKNGEGKSTLMKIISGIYELDGGELWQLPGTRVGYLPQDFDYANKDITAYNYLNNMIAKDDESSHDFKIEIVTEPLGIDLQKNLKDCSGGEMRRVYLAGALINNPDILLLDEPTNHLDIATIEWLENYIKSYKKSIICISHDRAFLAKTTNKMVYLDRGKLHSSNKGYAHFDKWYEDLLEAENKALEKLEKKLDDEEMWKLKGVTARRKRNQLNLTAIS